MSRRPYIRPMSKTTWYMRNGRFRHYMLKEMTCLLVGFYCFLSIWALAVLALGSEYRWNAFLETQQNVAMVIIHAFALLYFLVYQTIDWFKLAPKAMPVQLGDNKVPDPVIIIGHYVVWAVISLFIFWLVGVI